LDVIKEADQVKKANKSKNSNKSSATLNSNSSACAVGLTNASKLLMTLAVSGIGKQTPPPPPSNSGNSGNSGYAINNNWVSDSPNKVNEEQEINSEDLENIVKSIFSKLDVDGDGFISWWEWKSVLTASLCASNTNTNNSNDDDDDDKIIQKIISPVDPLLISIFAANGAMNASSSSSHIPKTVRFPEEYNMKELLAMISKLQQKFGADIVGYNNNFQQVVPQQGLLPIPEEDFGNTSKVASRLNQMVKSLRYSNNVLSKRLEDALLTSQQLQLANEQAPGSDNNNLNSQLNQYEQSLSTIKLQEHVENLDKQSLELLEQYEAAKARGDKLAIALMEQQLVTKANKKLRLLTSQEKMQQNEKLLEEIDKRTKELLEKKNKKMKRFKALVCLRMFFKNIVKPKLYAKMRNNASNVINSRLTSLLNKQKYSTHKKVMNNAVQKIQKLFRGNYVRNEMKQRKHAAISVQSMYRSHQAKQIVAIRRDKKQSINWLLKKNLANVIGRVWRKWKDLKLNNAAKKLTKAINKVVLDRRFEKRKNAIYKERESTKLMIAAVQIIGRNIKKQQ
jgi:hypothetical protein